VTRGWTTQAVEALTSGQQTPDHANRGMGWEATLRRQHERYREQGIARMDKLPTPIKRLRNAPGEAGKAGQFVAVYESPSGADFLGVLRGGRAVVLEAKRTEDLTWWSPGHVELTQARHLLDVADLGGVAGVLLLWAAHGVATWLPARPVGLAAKAVPPDWCERCADERRLLPGNVAEQIGRELSAGERARLGVPGIPRVRLDLLRAAGLCVEVGRDGVDWIGVAVGRSGGEA